MCINNQCAPRVCCLVLKLFIISSFIVIPSSVKAQDFEILGRLHMDAFYGLDDADDFSNGFNNRRARIGLKGTLNDNWDAFFEVDFADGILNPND